MKLSIAALRLAIATHLSTDIRVGFDAALSERIDDDAGDAVELTEAGGALLASINPDSASDIENLPLRSAALTFAGMVVKLDPADASVHPLIRDWTPPTFGGAVNQIILAGAALTSIAPGAPIFNSVAFRNGATGCSAAATMAFNNPRDVFVQLLYGAEIVPSALTTIHDIAADPLFSIGRESVTAPPASHGLEQDGLIKGASVTAFASAFVEAQAAATVH